LVVQLDFFVIKIR